MGYTHGKDWVKHDRHPATGVSVAKVHIFCQLRTITDTSAEKGKQDDLLLTREHGVPAGQKDGLLLGGLQYLGGGVLLVHH